MGTIVDALVASDEPSVRWKVRTRVLDEDPESRAIVRLRDEIRRSPRVRSLLEHVAGASYRKWSGGHWVLITLADIGYPPGDPDLEPLAERVMQTWLAPRYYAEFETTTSPYKNPGVPLMDGRYRRCGSQHGGALLAAVTLGVQPAATDRLVERLLHWQWPDGGWNCVAGSPPHRRRSTRPCCRCADWPHTPIRAATGSRATPANGPPR